MPWRAGLVQGEVYEIKQPLGAWVRKGTPLLALRLASKRDLYRAQADGWFVPLVAPGDRVLPGEPLFVQRPAAADPHHPRQPLLALEAETPLIGRGAMLRSWLTARLAAEISWSWLLLLLCVLLFGLHFSGGHELAPGRIGPEILAAEIWQWLLGGALLIAILQLCRSSWTSDRLARRLAGGLAVGWAGLSTLAAAQFALPPTGFSRLIQPPVNAVLAMGPREVLRQPAALTEPLLASAPSPDIAPGAEPFQMAEHEPVRLAHMGYGPASAPEVHSTAVPEVLAGQRASILREAKLTDVAAPMAYAETAMPVERLAALSQPALARKSAPESQFRGENPLGGTPLPLPATGPARRDGAVALARAAAVAPVRLASLDTLQPGDSGHRLSALDAALTQPSAHAVIPGAPSLATPALSGTPPLTPQSGHAQSPQAPQLAALATVGDPAPLPWLAPRYAKVHLLFQYMEDPRDVAGPTIGAPYAMDLPPALAIALRRTEVKALEPVVQVAAWCMAAGDRFGLKRIHADPEIYGRAALSDRQQLVLVEVELEADTIGLLSELLPVFGGAEVGFFHNRRPIMGGWQAEALMAQGRDWLAGRRNAAMDPNLPEDAASFYFDGAELGEALAARGCDRSVWQGGVPATDLGQAARRAMESRLATGS